MSLASQPMQQNLALRICKRASSIEKTDSRSMPYGSATGLTRLLLLKLALGQLDGNGQTYGIAAEMDLGGEPAARTAECLSPNPALVTGSTAMRADDRAVDHLQRVKHAATNPPGPAGERPKPQTHTNGET